MEVGRSRPRGRLKIMWINVITADMRKMNLTNLSGRVVVLTGAANGIGKHLALQFAKKNATLIITDKNQIQLIKVKNLCEKEGCKVLIMDVTYQGSPEKAKNFIKIIESKIQKIDYLILNHAEFQEFSLWEDLKNFELVTKLFNSNFFSYIYLITYAMPMLEVSNGRIIIMSSLVGKVPHPYLSLYGATKFALDGFFGSLKRELILANKNVNVTFIYLGSINTKQALANIETFRNGKLKRLISIKDYIDDYQAGFRVRGNGVLNRCLYYSDL
ncbi:hydroxysteroid 11-beta-dehydrogenase 1-like protein [Gordionus sp. m RMFG-2023]|uniref:hydroxysteroid 11-beta-dehydrogenase 1-like protein n=1 Tax=Gordionus sp. m RMFG-2023 TaxID=3053472 RepID=UPI0031FCFD19